MPKKAQLEIPDLQQIGEILGLETAQDTGATDIGILTPSQTTESGIHRPEGLVLPKPGESLEQAIARVAKDDPAVRDHQQIRKLLGNG